ncbi:MAG TPA: SAM-dependent methyltransferase [Chitinophagaceae bacterium]|nr:SAM-dependent methyltransferase [Chitinophagaceae bacterium]
MVYLIPSLLHEEGLSALPAYLLEAALQCQVFFVENERTARRFLKKLSRDIVIDDYEWHTVHKAEEEIREIFIQRIQEGKNIGIISEAGCPGVADPGQLLVAAAHQYNATVKPLSGPSSFLLALMSSGMNGQQFRFVGYLPIEPADREKTIRELEAESKNKNCTEVFIETPYRNDAMLDALLKTCMPSTRLCIAMDLTADTEWVKTKTISEWEKEKPVLHKRPSIFLLFAGQIN